MSEPDRLRSPSRLAALLVFLAVLGSNVVIGQLFAKSRLDEDWLLVAVPLVVFFWTVVGVVWFRAEPKETLLLRLPSWSDLLMALPLAISFVILSDQLNGLTDDLVPKELKEAQLRLLQASSPSEWALKLLTIGVGAAVSEELLFRGFLQSVLSRSMRPVFAVFWTSFLFMVIHGLPLPGFVAAGLVLGFLALATRSIVVPILVHFLNNASALALVNLADLETLGDPVWIPPEILIPALAIFVLTMSYYARKLSPETSPPAPAGEVPVVEARPGGHGRPSYAEELASVPPRRRRLGWLILIAAVLVGSSVLMGLFVYSLYVSHPQAVQATLIQALSEESRHRLDPDASDRAEDLAGAFDALSAVNDAGSLSLRHLFRVARSYAETSADGSIDSEEVDTLLASIKEAIGSSTSPRRL
ncbi:MAG: lysostaphin resistance A-like protein [Vicinamibacteria bacterium]